MAATQERRLSEFPTAANILLTTLLFGSVVDTTSTSGYDSVKILASDLANAILGDFAYTQDLQTNNKTIFGAINELRVLSGSATPDNAIGTNNQLYIKYNASDYSVVGLYVKLNNAWREISTGGGGNTDYIECTQAQYDAWEQGGTLDPDTLYFITDGNIGNDIIDDSTASETTVYSSDKVEDLLSELKTNNDINASYYKTSFVSGYIKRNNNVVSISLVLLATENISNNDTIIDNLPLPDSNYNLRLFLPTGSGQWQPNDFTSQCASITTQGSIGVIGSISSGKYIFIATTYICQ